MSGFGKRWVEEAALEYFESLPLFQTAFGPNLAADGPAPERESFEQVYLYRRLRRGG